MFVFPKVLTENLIVDCFCADFLSVFEEAYELIEGLDLDTKIYKTPVNFKDLKMKVPSELKVLFNLLRFFFLLMYKTFSGFCNDGLLHFFTFLCINSLYDTTFFFLKHGFGKSFGYLMQRTLFIDYPVGKTVS